MSQGAHFYRPGEPIQVPREVALDNQLSYTARGILLHLLALPEGTEVTIDLFLRPDLRHPPEPADPDDQRESLDVLVQALAELYFLGYLSDPVAPF